MRIFFTLALLFSCLFGISQKHTISGFVKEAKSGELLIGANVYNKLTYTGVASNNYGFYSLTLPDGPVEIEAKFVGYGIKAFSFDLKKDTTIDFGLVPSNMLTEVLVEASQAEKIQESSQMSIMTIPIKTIEKLPMLLGELDVIKALQLLPGVQSGSEGSSGLYVRGGGPDQNLILLDGVPVYNASHLFGFFSVFNTDAINSVELIKGGFPAQYGGRLSSVIDIRMKEGHANEFHGKGSIGIISSKLMLEGPIIKNRVSFMVSARRTYFDILARPLIKYSFRSTGGDGLFGYYFYDLNGKINIKLSDKDRIYLSSYFGDDKLFLRQSYAYDEFGSKKIENQNQFGLSWGNRINALRYNRVLTNKLFLNLTATYSKYHFSIDQFYKQSSTPADTNYDSEYGFGYTSGIYDWSGRLDFDYQPNANHTIKFGLGNTYHSFVPGEVNYKEAFAGRTLADTTLGASNVFSHEYFLYVQDDFKIGSRFKANMGLHYSGFVGSKNQYKSLQPRVSARYLITELLSVKASYAEMQQFIHLLTNSTIGLPTDIWLPSTQKLKPEYSRQIAAGLAYTYKEKFEISIEGYYKKMDGVIEYADGAEIFNIAGDWEDVIEVGTGWSYGAELFVQKKVGNTTGWFGYTLSWTNRQFENLNQGKLFPYRYDRRHDLSIVVTHEINDHIDIAGTWVYGTGNAISLPLESYPQAPSLSGWQSDVKYFEERNGYRMAAYHRMDFGINLHKELKRYKRTWSFGAYNVYSRQNPFFLMFQDRYIPGSNSVQKKLIQFSIFPIIPYATLSFEF